MSVMERRLPLLILLCQATCLWSSPSSAQPGVPTAAEVAFSAGSAAVAEEDFERALDQFLRARDLGMAGPAVHYNIGVCQYRLGRFASATSTFNLIADSYPAMQPLAHYNLGLIAYQQNDANLAREFLTRARQGPDTKIVQLAEAMLRRLPDEPAQATPPPGPVMGLVELRVGHDDNVALLADIAIPADQSAESSFLEVLAVLSDSAPRSAGFHFDASVLSAQYADAPQYDQNAVRGGGSYRWAGSWQPEAQAYYNHTTLDGNGFDNRLGIGAGITRALGSSTRLRIRLIHEDIDGASSAYSFVDGTRERLDFRLRHDVPWGALTLSYTLETNDRIDPSVSPDRSRWSLSYAHRLDAGWSLDVAVTARSSEYDELAEPRDEDLSSLSVGFRKSLGDHWSLSGDYGLSDNATTVEAFDYDRRQFALGLMRTF